MDPVVYSAMCRRAYPLRVLAAQHAYAVAMGAEGAPPLPLSRDDVAGKEAVVRWLATLYGQQEVSLRVVNRRALPAGMCYLTSPLPVLSQGGCEWIGLSKRVLHMLRGGTFELSVGVTDALARDVSGVLDTPGMWPVGSACPLYKRWKEYARRYECSCIVAVAVSEDRSVAELEETRLSEVLYHHGHGRLRSVGSGAIKDAYDRKGAVSKQSIAGSVLYIAVRDDKGKLYALLAAKSQSLEVK